MPVSFDQDSPLFRNAVDALFDTVKSIQSAADRLAKAESRDSAASLKRAEAGAAFADEFLAVGQSSLGSGPSEDGAQSLPHVCSDVAAGLRDAYAAGTSEAVATRAGAVSSRAEADARRCKLARMRFRECDEGWVASLRKSHAVRVENDESVQRADLNLSATRLAFETSRFELCAALNETEAAKQLELLEIASATVAEHLAFFEAGAARLRLLAAKAEEWTPAIEQKRLELAEAQQRNAECRAHLSDLSSRSRSSEPDASQPAPPPNPPPARAEAGLGGGGGSSGGGAAHRKEGYLFKKSSRAGRSRTASLAGQETPLTLTLTLTL